MWIYISASMPRIKEARSLAAVLSGAGHRICSGWLDTDREVDLATIRQGAADVEAIRNMRDVMDCHLFVMLAGDKKSRGGRHVEFGMAMALHKRCVIIGARENVFHSHPLIEVCSNVEALTKLLQEPYSDER